MAEIGMRYPVWAELTSESNNTPVYGTGKVMGKAISANLTWEKDDSELYGDDAVAETDGSIVGYNLDLGTTQLAEDVEAAILGYKKVGDTDEYEITDDPAPYGGVGYIRVLKRNGVRLYKAVWYPKIQFGKNSESSNTKQRNISWGTPTLNGKGLAVYNDSTGKAKFRQQRVFSSLESARSYLNSKANISS
jgi:phi13 family phage major tail protein